MFHTLDSFKGVCSVLNVHSNNSLPAFYYGGNVGTITFNLTESINIRLSIHI